MRYPPPSLDKRVNRIKANAAEAKVNEARAFNAAQVCYALLASVMGERRPLDKSLAKLFRENKRFGSQDRRLIAETIFSLCRWWGWVKVLVPKEDVSLWGRLDRSCLAGTPGWFLPLYAAWQLDGFDGANNAVTVWAHWNKIRGMTVEKNRSLAELASAFAEGYKVETPEVGKLFPEWLNTIFPGSEDFEALYPWLQKRPPLWLRAQGNTQGILQAFDAMEAKVVFSDALPEALKIVDARLNLFETDAVRNGWVEVQDISSQCVGKVCAPKPGQRWLDYCAGAGGKTLQLAAMMQSKGEIVAVDKRNWKLDDLKKRARRAGFSNIRPRVSEGAFPKVPGNSFDGVLVDAPCSCTGTWRRNPDARWSSSLEEIAELSELQQSILEHACKAVRVNGVLIYATCSFAEAENEAVARAFAEKHPEFVFEGFEHPLKKTPCPDGMLRIRPCDGDGDAMFIAKFKRVK